MFKRSQMANNLTEKNLNQFLESLFFLKLIWMRDRQGDFCKLIHHKNFLESAKNHLELFFSSKIVTPSLKAFQNNEFLGPLDHLFLVFEQ